jgi:hypothetical protein
VFKVGISLSVISSRLGGNARPELADFDSCFTGLQNVIDQPLCIGIAAP